MTQPDLFEPRKLHRTSDPWTSAAAAHSMESDRSRLHRMIMTVLRNSPKPLHAEGISDRTFELDKQQVVRRLNELERMGLIVEDGEARQRSNRKARCFRAVS